MCILQAPDGGRPHSMKSANGIDAAPSVASGSRLAASGLLQIEGLKTYFATRGGDVRAVDGVDLTIRAGETVGLVGESGSGKSVTARSIMRLVQMPPGRFAGGKVVFDGTDLLTISDREMQRLRGGKIS